MVILNAMHVSTDVRMPVAQCKRQRRDTVQHSTAHKQKEKPFAGQNVKFAKNSAMQTGTIISH